MKRSRPDVCSAKRCNVGAFETFLVCNCKIDFQHSKLFSSLKPQLRLNFDFRSNNCIRLNKRFACVLVLGHDAVLNGNNRERECLGDQHHHRLHIWNGMGEGKEAENGPAVVRVVAAGSAGPNQPGSFDPIKLCKV